MTKPVWKVTPFHEGGYVLVRTDADDKHPITTIKVSSVEEAEKAIEALGNFVASTLTKKVTLLKGPPKSREEEEEEAWKAHEELNSRRAR